MSSSYFAHPTAVIDEGATIGAGCRIWHFCHVMGSATIGGACTLGQNVFVGEKVKLGRNVKVQNNVSLFEGLICEDEVFIGPSAVFTNVINPRSAISRKQEFRPTHLEQGVTIGANATILCGNRIGRFAFIGAGAVVTKNVDAYALMLGNPARRVGWMSERGHKLYFNEEGFATCVEGGETYRLADGEVEKV